MYTGKVGRPKETEVLGASEKTLNKGPTILGASSVESPVEIYDGREPPEQPDVNLEAQTHDTRKSFKDALKDD